MCFNKYVLQILTPQIPTKTHFKYAQCYVKISLKINKQKQKKCIKNSCSIDCCGLSRKLPVCCFRGFLRSDTLIGTVTVKLAPLETNCDIHDTYDVSVEQFDKLCKIEYLIDYVFNYS